MSKICANCKSKFDEKERIPINLKCSHSLCLECHKNLKNNFGDDYCPICKKKSIKAYSSTKLFNSNDKNNKSYIKRPQIEKFKFPALNKNRRLSHAINYNNSKVNLKLNNNEINGTFPKIKLRRMSIDSTSLAIQEYKKKKKKSHNSLINNIKKINKSYDISIKNNEKEKINLDTKKSKLLEIHKKSISHYINHESSSELESYNKTQNNNNKTLNNYSKIKENNNNNNEIAKDKDNNIFFQHIINESCSIHVGKEIEFYCNTCSSLACSLCLIDFHNGHNFGLLYDVIDKIKININDADNILNELLHQNFNNQKKISLILNEINELNNNQNLFVKRSFDEIFNKLTQVQQTIIEEFNKKYSLEFKRIEKLQKILEEDINEIKRTKIVINEILKVFDTSSEVKALKQKKSYDNFLFWCNINIKRIFKNQKKVKNEMFVDPSFKPKSININELMNLLNSIEPKKIVYPALLKKNLTISDDSNIIIENNVNKNSNVNASNLKNNNSYSFMNQTQYYNFRNNYNLKKNYSDDLVLHVEMPMKTYEDYSNKNNRYSNLETFNNNSYNDNSQNIENNMNRYYIQKRMINYNQQNQNAIYSNNENISETNLGLSQKLPNSQSQVTPAQKLQQIYFNSNNNEEIDKFYNIMKMNNEIAIYCFTNLNCCLLYHIPSQNWRYIPYLNEISQQICFQKNSSICLIPNQRMIITGGYNSLSKEATDTVFQFDIYDINDIKLLKPMKIRRYSHCCIYLSNYVYCIGGYGYNEDKSNSSSSLIISLKSCEKYDIKRKEWKLIKELNSARACFGRCIYNNNIFVFGGYDNKNILSSIEKYEPITDIWITYHIKLPMKIAELGIININNKYIFILGGIDENKNLLDNVYIGRLDHNFVNYSWREGPKLICPRNVGNNVFYWNNYIYVIGGSSEGVCEKYNLLKQKWEMIKSYLNVFEDLRDEIKIKYFTSEINFNASMT